MKLFHVKSNDNFMLRVPWTKRENLIKFPITLSSTPRSSVIYNTSRKNNMKTK